MEARIQIGCRASFDWACATRPYVCIKTKTSRVARFIVSSPLDDVQSHVLGCALDLAHGSFDGVAV